MFTIIIVFCIVFYFVYQSYNTPDKKNTAKDKQEIESLPDVCLSAKHMEGFNRFLNLSYDYERELAFFGYSNGLVTIKMKSGHIMRAYLHDLVVRFDKPKSSPIQVTVNHFKDEINFYEMVGLLKSEEWRAIYHILSLARTTYGLDIFKYEKLNKGIGYANTALKIIQHL